MKMNTNKIKSVNSYKLSTIFIFALVMFMGLSLLQAVPVEAVEELKTWYVDASVSESGDGKSVETAFKTIGEGVTAASAGDTIIVAAGTYDETLAIEKSLTLQGESKENTTIDGRGNSPCIRVEASNVVINGFTIKNNKAAGEAIRFYYGCTTCTIENCNITTSASTGYGVHIYGSNNITIQNNNISGGTYGVIADQGVSNYIKIKDNTMANLRDGVILQSGTGHEVEGNNISTTLSNSKAIEVHTSDTAVKDNILSGPGSSGVSIDLKLNIVVEGNEISGKTTAIHVGNDALNARVKNNILSSNREGIHVQTGPWKEANLNISGNTISNSTVADIYVSGSQGPINIWENDISGGPCGVKIEDSGDRKSTGVSINSNSIHGHTEYGVNNEAVETVDATRNWWGAASGPNHASNPDGTGDKISDKVLYYPWYTDENLTTLYYNAITLTKTGPANAKQGDEITYTIKYKNEGKVAETNVVITETYPPEVEFVEASRTPDAGTNNRWTIGTLAPGAEGTITVRVRIK